MFREKIKEAFWEIIRPSLNALKRAISSLEFRQLLVDQVKRRATVKMCIDKASRCYKILTGYTLKPFSVVEVERAIFYSPNLHELLLNLRKCSFGCDEQFVILLYYAVINTYIPSTPIWCLNGGFSANIHSIDCLPDKR